MNKMFRLGTLIMLLLLINVSFATGTLKILLVDDDNYSSPDHIVRIEKAIEDAGYSYTIFNAQDSSASPTAELMGQYDLVFWYTANDGVGSFFWAGSDTTNFELKAYLDNGGMIWAMGNDLIYDMYGGAPDTFQTGDILYDYFGLQSYDVQSRKDDGGSGVPMLIREPGQQIATSLDTIHWYFSSGGLWYGDGCTPRPEAQVVYRFGDETYALNGYATAIYFDNGTSKAFGCYFDAYYMDTDQNRASFFKDVLDYFSSQLSTSMPPTDFSLSQPENDSWQAIGNSADSVTFKWTQSSDPEGTSITYKFYLSTTTDITESSVYEKETNDNVLSIANTDLQNLVAANDTSEFYWTVRARDDDYATTWAADTFKITLVNKVNQPPTPFTLLSPADQAQYVVDNMNDSLTFEWEASNDPEGGELHQTFDYWSADFGGEKMVPTNHTSLSNAELLNLLNGRDSLLLSWTVKVSDIFGATTTAQDTFTVTLINRYNVFTTGPELDYPQNMRHFFFKSDRDVKIDFRWIAAEAYRQPLYHLTIMQTDGTVLLQKDTTATEATVNLKDVLANMPGDSLQLMYDISASLDTNTISSENGPYSLGFVRQIAKILAVFDDNHTNHSQTMRQSFAKLNLDYTDFDCGNDGNDGPQQIPDFTFMKDFDVIFWFTGNDGKNLAFWMGTDTTNSALQQYLDNGGRFWVVGNDFLYDRYGGAPDTFKAGDFVYDYLGVSSYDAQSKKDDGGSGVPLIYLDRNSAPDGIADQDTLSWKYKTLWYADALTPVEQAKTVYRMGPESYALAGSPTFISYVTPEFITLTTAFNARQFKEDNDMEMLDRFLFNGLNWLQHQTLTALPQSREAIPSSFAVAQNFPNPFNPSTNIPIALPKAGNVKLTVYNALGQRIMQQSYRLSAGNHLLKIQAQNMASGIYYYRLKFDGKIITKKMILLK